MICSSSSSLLLVGQKLATSALKSSIPITAAFLNNARRLARITTPSMSEPDSRIFSAASGTSDSSSVEPFFFARIVKYLRFSSSLSG